ncbi:MAG: tryptophan synthase subunit alpha [Planctomycetes bacterium]|nr:tryptophan synthase subunit alpha [Planctomycetota bacterium]
MSAIDQMFRQLRADGRKAFMPFITAGDPDLAFTGDVLRLLASRGCHMGEVGIPYSDPIADGPVIQASFTRALSAHVGLEQIMRAATSLTPSLPMPLVTMVSYAIVYRHGLETFVASARAAGFAGTIVPDLPIEESGPLARICRQEDFSLIHLVTPTTPFDRARRIADASSGFLYYVSVTGITGERSSLPAHVGEHVLRLREATPLPVCVGFGISTPEHVRLLAPVADGLIVGSALVRRIAEAASRPRADVLQDIQSFADELLAALPGGPAAPPRAVP